MPRRKNPEKKQVERRPKELREKINLLRKKLEEFRTQKNFGKALETAIELSKTEPRHSPSELVVPMAMEYIEKVLQPSKRFSEESKVEEFIAGMFEKTLPQKISEEEKTAMTKTIFVWLNWAADSAEKAGDKKRSIELRLKSVQFAFKRKKNADEEKNSK